MLTPSDDCRLLIRGIEKLATTFYYDGKGIATVGYGHAIVMNGAQVSKTALGQAHADALATQYMMQKWGSTTISPAQADALFNEDLQRFVDAVNAVCDAATYQCEFDAMVSFAFNCGPSGFAHSSVAKSHQAGQRKVGDISISDLAAWSKSPAAATPTNLQQDFVAWSKSGGEWELGLFRRRLAELLVYSGRKAQDAITTAWSYKG